tara:strand:- start:1137 stop:1403 length:267 start_codon:yes stop_codon:yes gene_type:complete
MPKQEKPFDGGKYTYVYENKFKEQDNHPDYSGNNLIVNGEEKDVAMWHGVSKKTGSKYLSVRISSPMNFKKEEPKKGSSDENGDDLPF